MSVITVRLANFNDLDAVASLFDLYRQFYKKSPNLAGARSYLETRLTNKDSSLFVAESEDGTLAGFAQLYPSFSSLGMSRTWILNDLYVTETHRRSGIATSLIKTVHAYAKSTGATSINLETQHDNKKAQALYEKFGYEAEQDFLFYSLSLNV